MKKILFSITILLASHKSYGLSKKTSHNQFNHIYAPEPTSTQTTHNPPKKLWESSLSTTDDKGPIKVVLFNEETGQIIENVTKAKDLPYPKVPQSTPTETTLTRKDHTKMSFRNYSSETLKSDYELESDDDDETYETISRKVISSESIYPPLPKSLPLSIPSSHRTYSLTTNHDESSSDDFHNATQLLTPSAPPAPESYYSTPEKKHHRQRSASDGTIKTILQSEYNAAPPSYEDSKDNGLKRTKTNPLLNFTEKRAEEIQKSLEQLQKDLDEKITEIETLQQTPYEDRQASFLQRVFLSTKKQEAKSLKEQDKERQKKIDPLQNEAIKLASTIGAIKKKLGKQ